MSTTLATRSKMAVCSLLRLSLTALALTCGAANAQAQTDSSNHCNDDAWRTKVTQHLFSYAYTSPEWQRYCDTILAECPDYAYIWQMKAMPKLKSGLYEDGIKFLDRAAALNPDHDIPYRGFMKCIFIKDYEGALVDFEAAEKMSPGNGLMDHTHYFYMGLCHLGLGAPDKAKPFLVRDLEHQQARTGKGNEHYNSLLYMGICCLQLQQHAEAETWLKASLKAYSRFPEANFYLGLTYAQTGQKNKAIASLEQARKFLKEGASMNEDNNAYVNYPFQIGLSDIDAAIADISALK